MIMTDVQIRVPDGLIPYIVVNDEQSEMRRNAMFLYPYIKNMTISHGKAAEILGVHKYELIDLYEKLGISYIDQTIEEVEEEVEYWKRLGHVCAVER